MKRPVVLLSVILMMCMVSLLISSGQHTSAQAQSAPSQKPTDYFDVPVNIEAPIRPIPVKGSDGKYYLVYHLFLTNWSFSDLTLKLVEVSDGKTGTTLVQYGDKELSDFYRFRSVIPTPSREEMPGKTYPRQISSGKTGALFFWLKIAHAGLMPPTLRHRFIFAANPLIRVSGGFNTDKNGDLVLDNYSVPVKNEKPIIIGPPLRDGLWLCGNGPGYNTAHQSLSLRQGNVRIAQRFGIDFKKVDAQGNALPSPFPDEITNKMFYGYGAEVLAVANGTVVYVKDGLPENVPQATGEFKPAVPINRETTAGNWIAIDLGDDHYAFYAHLQPGSIRVKTGERVRRGQVIALLGNSGNAIGPHLHFHIGNQYSLNGGDLNGNEGLPFVFDSFDLMGQARRHFLEIPLNNDVIRFP